MTTSNKPKCTIHTSRDGNLIIQIVLKKKLKEERVNMGYVLSQKSQMDKVNFLLDKWEQPKWVQRGESRPKCISNANLLNSFI